MKIVHILPCLKGGGIQNFLVSLAPEQVKMGHDVTVVTTDEDDLDYSHHLQSILESRGEKVMSLNRKVHNKLSTLKALLNCRKLIKKLNPEIVNTHSTLSYFYGALAVKGIKGVRQIATIHSGPEEWSKMVTLTNKNTPLIYCSHSAMDLRTQQNKNIIAIDNGISRDIVHSDKEVDLKKELNLPDDAIVVVLVGSLRPEKNYEFLKELSTESGDPRLHFCVCGGNYGSEYLKAEDFKDFDHIHMMGLRSDVSAIENKADVFMNCSTREGLPISVLEAYFNGIPCVLAPIPQLIRISDMPEVWVSEDTSVKAYVEAIHKAAACKKSHEEIYEERKPKLEPFSIRHCAEEYIKFYEQNSKR